MGVGGLMALERDPSTTKNAVLLLQGAGRGSISEHGAQMAIELLESNGFQIWEIKPDEPAAPEEPPKPTPRRGSLESLHEKMHEIRDLDYKQEELRRDFYSEFQEAVTDFRPVFQAIRMALDPTNEIEEI
jgi:hypothetical protein